MFCVYGAAWSEPRGQELRDPELRDQGLRGQELRGLYIVCG